MSLSCDSGDGYADFYQSTMRKARKEHLCRECGVTIKPGELYQYEITVFDGDFQARKSCEKCSDLVDSLVELGFCPEFGNLANDYREYLELYTKSVRYDEESDTQIYPANHLIDESGYRRQRKCSTS